ncbi:GntR family transcriptional regulator [Levyella massiliensis]|uniref:GntR family transcriptional regulator n=1 Tax=Levyella massiliensis TaxID=938289 RepID=UPI000376A213|nr:GntR family transcriptional regulator [Levyella massiliensis]
MKVILSNQSEVPLYRQIEAQIKDAILRQELKEGDPLPSIRRFAGDLNVSVLTIRRVYSELEDEGLVQSRAGLGTFVRAGDAEHLQQSQCLMVEEQLREVIRNARLLRVPKGALLQMVQELYEEE